MLIQRRSVSRYLAFDVWFVTNDGAVMREPLPVEDVGGDATMKVADRERRRNQGSGRPTRVCEFGNGKGTVIGTSRRLRVLAYPSALLFSFILADALSPLSYRASILPRQDSSQFSCALPARLVQLLVRWPSSLSCSPTACFALVRPQLVACWYSSPSSG